MQVRNFMEDIVFEKIDKIMKDLEMCQCDICKYDTAAIALNNLPPKYVVTDKGELYIKMNLLQQQFDIDTMLAITRAATIVKKFPRHEVDSPNGDAKDLEKSNMID